MNNNPIAQNNEKKAKKGLIVKYICIFIILASLIVGIVFSSSSFADNYKLGSDFSGYYSALVEVRDVKQPNRADNQPNGDAKQGAKALDERLNPMGTNQIIIETAGANYLKVLSPIEAYDNETVFINQIQRNGGVILLDENWTDSQFSSEGSRQGINDYFTSAKATSSSATSGTGGRQPAIEYTLNGDAFKTLVSSGEASKYFNIMIDVDGFYNDLRNYYKITNEKEIEKRIEEFFDVVIFPLRTIYNSSETDLIVKRALYDIFYGEYLLETGTTNRIVRTSLMDSNIRDAEQFAEIESSFKYLSDTTKYVYDPNAKSEDFNSDGKYSEPLKVYTSSNSLIQSPISDDGTVDKVFAKLNPSILNVYYPKDGTQGQQMSKYMDKHFLSYFLFRGNISDSDPIAPDPENEMYSQRAFLSAGIINGNKLTTTVETDSKAQIGASLFNASSKGFMFSVSNVTTISGAIQIYMLITAIIFMLILAIALLVYMSFVYRLLGLFSLIITLALIGITLLSTTWFGLTLGPESLVAILILAALNIEIFSLIFENMKNSYFNKQRGIKTSFNISIKENIGIGLDIIVSILLPSICMFWITSNAIQSFAIILAMGSMFMILFTILSAILLFKLTISTNIFTKYPHLFALNTNFANKGKVFLNYRIVKLENDLEKYSKLEYSSEYKMIQGNNFKLTKLEEKVNKKNNKINSTIENLEQKIKTSNSEREINKIKKEIQRYKELLNKINTYKDKEIFKINEKIKEFEIKLKNLDNSKQIKKVQKDLEKYKEKLAKVEQQKIQKSIDQEKKNELKLKQKISKLESQIKVLDPEKKAKKIQKLNFKIANYNYLLTDDTQKILEQESEVSLSTTDKVKLKAYEKSINNGAKTFSLFAVLLLIISLLFGFLVGPNYDHTFGGRIEYTMWGSTIDEFYNKGMIEASDYENSNQQTKEYLDELIEKVDNPLLSDEEREQVQAEAVAEFINYSFINSSVANTYISTSQKFKSTKVETSVGNDFKLNGSNNDGTNVNWVTLTVYTTSVKQSNAIKSYFEWFGVTKKGEIIDSSKGFITKRIKPAIMIWMVLQIAWSILVIILALLIYIFIRFKWTYYIAMVVGILLTPVLTAAAIVALQIPFGTSAFIAIVATTSFITISLFTLFGKARAMILSKDEKSLEIFFNQEIEILYNLKDNKKKIKDELFFKKADNKFALQTLTKTEKKELKKKQKLEYKEFKHKKWMEYKDIKKESKIKINRISKNNNYLKEVMVETFIFGIKRNVLISLLYIISAVLLSISITPMIGFGVSVIFGVIAASFITLFICLPLWIFLEHIRIRNRLAHKRFINNLVVTNEEQIIEGIND